MSSQSQTSDRDESAAATASPVRVQIGGFCIKGSGHTWTYEEGADGCSGWEMFIEIDPEDVHLFPEWVQEMYRYAVSEASRV